MNFRPKPEVRSIVPGVPDPRPSESGPNPFVHATVAVLRPVRNFVGAFAPSESSLELQIAGRVLFHAALVGLGAGIMGCAFFAGAEIAQNYLLEHLAGYDPLRAVGEKVIGGLSHAPTRLWLLALIPALGALVASFFIRYAPECGGGGGDATIEAFHHHNGVLRRRVIWVKPLASIATLGAGGSGGREGPTMLIGGAIGSVVGRYLRVTARERRVLMVAGVAAGISAVFRAPLGAALIAIEMLYRDDFESDALIPSVLASVMAYSVSISVFGEATLFGHLRAYAFTPGHIPLYILLAVVVSAAGSLFVAALRVSQRLAGRIPVAKWFHPAVGGLVLGIFVVLWLHFFGPVIGRTDQGLGILGGGYGAAQVAITGADWLPLDWRGVEILVLLALVKIVASSITIGTGGSAGDFAPALAVGGMLGGAFGLAARLISGDPTIEPGAFALVGMGTLYGGIAKTPLAALVLICEIAGSYELLVPLMLAEGVAFLMLRKVLLYPAQVPALRDSPAHRRDNDALSKLRCADVLGRDRECLTFATSTKISELTERIAHTPNQDVFPIVDAAGELRGIVSAEALRVVASNPDLHQLGIAADLMIPPVSVPLDSDLRIAAQLMVAHDLRSLPVIDPHGAIVGLIDEHDITSVAVV